MNHVIDASVVLKWFAQESLSEEALRLVDGNNLLRAPDLIVAEVTNIFWKKRALEIALELRHTVYDCLYLACAERIGGVLITADVELVSAVVQTPFAPLIRALGAPALDPP